MNNDNCQICGAGYTRTYDTIVRACDNCVPKQQGIINKIIKIITQL